MRTKEIIATIAIVGSVATIALLNVNQQPMKSTFLKENAFTVAEQEFINYLSKYHRSYGTKEEYNYRLGVFTQNYYKIMNHNEKNSDDEGYVMGINHFTDLTSEEFKKMLGFRGETV